MRWGWLIGCLGLLLATPSVAQTCRWIPVSHRPVVLADEPLVPGSVALPWVADADWTYSPADRSLRWTCQPTGLDSVEVCYTTVLQQVARPYQLHTYAEYDSTALFRVGPSPKNPSLTRAVFGPESGLVPTGFLSRSLAVGNQQNVFLNSRFQLEVSGELSEDLSLSAELRDSQLPFQPEGNTQQLRDFDRVYLEVAHRRGVRVGAGDVTLRPQPGRFLQYQKQAMGLTGAYETETTQTRATVGQGRGRFVSQWLSPEEGVAGPYRLLGQQGEAFIQILAGSERIYVDETLLTRGETEDYTIDYNLAELTFTPRVSITRTSRVRVEFEYAERSYPRQLVEAQVSHQLGNWELWAQGYRQSDNAIRPYAFTLTQDLAATLATFGGGEAAQIPSADSVGYTRGAIRYARRDTALAAETYSVYVYSTRPEEAHWTVRFSRVGPGQGNYVQGPALPQGWVYRWVAPVAGVPQGDYAPVVEVPLPTQQQVVSGGARFAHEGHRLELEAALSQYEANQYQGTAPESDGAFWLAYASPSAELLGYQWQVSTQLESSQTGFRPVERYRAVDFDRFWQGANLVDSVGTFDHWGRVRLEGTQADGDQLWVEQGGRYVGPSLQGWEQAAGLRQRLGRWALSGKVYALQGTVQEQASTWQQHTYSLVRQGAYWQPGYRYTAEQQAFRDLATDSLLRAVQHWQQHALFVRSGDSLAGQWEVGAQWREDQQVQEGMFTSAGQSRALYAQWDPKATDQADLSVLAQWRTLQGHQEATEHYLNGQVQGHWQPWTGFRLQGSLSTQTSRELQREFVYLPVPLGQGTHTWQDRNGDGEATLDEYVEALYYNERQYARFFVPTQTYLPAQSHIGQATASLQAPAEWQHGARWQQVLSRLSAVGQWEHRQKTTLGDAPLRLSEAARGSATLYWNRRHPDWGLEGGLSEHRHQQLLSQGTETSAQWTRHVSGRWHPLNRTSLHLRYEQGQRNREAAFWEGQSWQLAYHKVEPELRWQAPQHWRLSGGYRWQQTQSGVGEGATVQEVQSRVQWQGDTGDHSLQGQLSYLAVDYQGVNANTPLGYQLLEGLRPGQNWILRLDWQRQLPSGLQLLVFYEGRTGPDRWLHAGNAQVAWRF